MKHLNYYSYILFFFIIITLSLLGISILKDKSKVVEEIEEKSEEFREKQIIEYKANETIRVRMSSTNEIIAMDVNDYLRGVLPSEMSPTYNDEALKAQAVVARTYLYKKMQENREGTDADICDSFAHCQAYTPREKLIEIWKEKGYTDIDINTFLYKINEAVITTQNQIIIYDNNLIDAYFHASSPVRTEALDQIWGGTTYLPYLVSVENDEEEDYQNRTSCNEFDIDLLNQILETNGYVKITSEQLQNVEIVDYTSSGRVKNLKIGSNVILAEKLRTMLGLKSTNFSVECDSNKITFNVVGYGHGVGMSQVGANTLANKGKKYDEIIKYYYTGVEIITLD